MYDPVKKGYLIDFKRLLSNTLIPIKIAKSLAGFCRPEKSNHQNHEKPR
ncbi:hypothetical protein V144x_51230 [Gimesia aquarii]|uniref:Uncharacterized protein n=1 Tax=Gimesia aquarii TaxID=2527964 RepID=A0A517W2W8_9PLAN|nr:hypothetical protein V144x_51230 [Gimesia aquarii]